LDFFGPVVYVKIRRSTLNPPNFVIPSEARDLQFAAKVQIPRFARDDNSQKMLLVRRSPTFTTGCYGRLSSANLQEDLRCTIALPSRCAFGGHHEFRAGDHRRSGWSGEPYVARTAGPRFAEPRVSVEQGALLWNPRLLHPARRRQGTSARSGDGG